jgi:hypothetical protein
LCLSAFFLGFIGRQSSQGEANPPQDDQKGYTVKKSRLPVSSKLRKKPRSKEIAGWSKELVRLRAEVEELSSQLRMEREQALLALRTAEGRRAPLRWALDQETMRWRRLQAQIERLRSEQQRRSDAQKAIQAALVEALGVIRKAIQESLPFRREERLRLVERIGLQTQAGQIDAEQGVAQLWRIVEDELRLTTLVERAEIPVRLSPSAAPRLVKVVRVGMVAMFLEDGKGGYYRILREKAGGWGVEPISSAKQRAEIQRLFADLERQIREGFYRLPLGHKGEGRE